MSNGIETNVSSNVPAIDFEAMFYGAGKEGATETTANEGDEGGTGAPVSGAETAAELAPDLSGEDAGNTEPEQWTFNGATYDETQVSDALKHRETYERFNQSITPLIENIKAFGQVAERQQVMAKTETENQITELRQRLQTPGLSAADYQQTHQALQSAEWRMNVLDQAAANETQKRNEALVNARRHNATQVAATLARSGWNGEQMTQAQSILQGVMKPDQFADVVSVGFMEILRDAYAFRAGREKTAAALKDKARKAVKVSATNGGTPPPQTKTVAAGSPEWMNAVVWGKK